MSEDLWKCKNSILETFTFSQVNISQLIIKMVTILLQLELKKRLRRLNAKLKVIRNKTFMTRFKALVV